MFSCRSMLVIPIIINGSITMCALRGEIRTLCYTFLYAQIHSYTYKRPKEDGGEEHWEQLFISHLGSDIERNIFILYVY